MTDQVETPTGTSKAKPSPNSAGQKGKNTVSIYLELDGLDDVADDAFKVESYKTNVSLTIASVAGLDEYAKAVNATGRENRFSLKTKDEERSRVANPTPPDPGSTLPADPLVTPPDRSCMGDPTYELDRPQYYVFDRGSTWKQKACALVKQMDHVLQLIRSCPLRDTEHSMSMKRHTTEQNMTTVEDGHNTANDGETHNENRREIQTQQHSKLNNLREAEHILQIRESSGHEEQHSRSFHETP